jgi:hypothetical protein
MLIGFNNEGVLWTIAGGAVALGLQHYGYLGEERDGLFHAWFLTIGSLDAAYRVYVVRPKLENCERGPSLKERLYASWLTSPLGGLVLFLPAWLVALLTPLWLLYVVGVEKL